MPFDPLLRRVEEASLNSWPAPRQIVFDGWVLRFAGGYTRRANSATPLDPGQGGPTALLAKITACEALYAAQGLPALIRTRSFGDAALAETLDARGYAAEGLSSVLWMPLGPDVDLGHAAEGVELSETRPGPDWLDTQARLSGCDIAARKQILDAMALPHAFASVKVDGPGFPLVSLAFGAVHDGIVCLHLVATDPIFRRLGLSRRVVSALLVWAHDRAGARGASLQVAADNKGARALYAGLGFRTELFCYQYRRQPSTGFSSP